MSKSTNFIYDKEGNIDWQESSLNMPKSVLWYQNTIQPKLKSLYLSEFVEYIGWVLTIVLLAAWAHVFYRLFLQDTINFSIMFGLFYQSEQEPANMVDINTFISQVLFSSTLVLITGWIFYSFPGYIASPLVLNILMWSVYLLLLPTTLCVIFGTYILNYLKGDTDSNSRLYAGIFDLSALISFVIRFLVQLVRYVFIYAKMGLYVICTEETFRMREMMGRLNYKKFNDDWAIMQLVDDFINLIISFFHTLFEICNVVIIYYTQFGAFSLVLLWLLKALYSYALPIAKYIWLDDK